MKAEDVQDVNTGSSQPSTLSLHILVAFPTLPGGHNSIRKTPNLVRVHQMPAA